MSPCARMEPGGGSDSPLRRLSTGTRLLLWAIVMAGVLLLKPLDPAQLALGTAVVVGWSIVCRLRGLRLRLALIVVLTFLLPALLLLLIPGTAAALWQAGVRTAWTVMLSVALSGALDRRELTEWLAALPAPPLLHRVSEQVSRAVPLLATESAGMARAIALRGGTGNRRGAWRLIASLPVVWLPRVLARAERTAWAMEIREPMTGLPRGAAPAPPPEVLRFQGVGVRYPQRRHAALSDIDLALPAGVRLALLGLNGSGKTTLLMVPTGLIPFQGSCRVSGVEVVAGHLPEVRRRLGVVMAVPEDQLLRPRVAEDVAFGLLQDPALASPRARALHWLDRLGVVTLAEEPTHRLSGGETLRVALAGALARQPSLLLLDEPSSALDPPGRRQLARLLADLPGTMMMATHDLPLARACATHFVVLAGGRLPGPMRPISELPDDPFI